MDRIRPSTLADYDAFLTESLVQDTGHSPAGGLILESSGVALAFVDYGFAPIRVSRGKMGWTMEEEPEALSSPCLSISRFKAARYTSVLQVSALMQAVQNVALERALEWVVAVPKIDYLPDLRVLQASLQRDEVSHPMCALLWELGFVDLIAGQRLIFLWRNPAF